MSVPLRKIDAWLESESGPSRHTTNILWCETLAARSIGASSLVAFLLSTLLIFELVRPKTLLAAYSLQIVIGNLVVSHQRRMLPPHS